MNVYNITTNHRNSVAKESMINKYPLTVTAEKQCGR